jgi:ribosomal peptide maturation radical SAM protein 1
MLMSVTKEEPQLQPIALVCMPWQALDSPSLQVGLLASLLDGLEIPHQEFSMHLGLMDFLTVSYQAEKQPFEPDDYRQIADRWADIAVGDWVFATEELRAPSQQKDRKFEQMLDRRGMAKDLRKKLLRLRARVPAYIEWAADEILASSPSAVGFTLTFTQTFASLALAKELRRRQADLPIVIGGAACAAPMGRALLEAFPWVDAAVSGEAEAVAGALFRALRNGEAVPELPGVARRDGATALPAPPEGKRLDMDAVPSPQFDEFFQRLQRSPMRGAITPRIPFESARGCWWGEKAHCTFCGLNAMDMTFRSKSADRTVDELFGLSERHHVLDFTAADNILDQSYLKSVIPALIERGQDFRIFYETKSNLDRDEITQLKRAGVNKIQPGIESLSTHTLKLMRKGVTGLQNVRLLKWSAEEGLEVAWNMLFGFPGELPEEYERVADVVLSIVHLQPPSLGPIVIDRFSPYHEDPASFGIELHDPLPHYALLYDTEMPLLGELAYTFQHSYVDGRKPQEYVFGLSKRLRRWHKEASVNRGALTYRRGPGFLQIRDERTTTESALYELEGVDAAVYDALDEGASVVEIREHVGKALGEKPEEAAVRRILGELVEARLVLEERERYLSLALPADSVQQA